MIFYIVFFLISLGGSAYIVLRHKGQLSEQYDTFAAEHPATFAYFMNDIAKELHGLWDVHMRDQALLFIEKRLRWVRILVLKTERALYRATHHVRNASNRNGTDTSADNTATINEASADTTELK